MTPQQTRLKNDLAALGALHKFGWLRAQELGWWLWPHTTKHGQTQACRAAQSWVKRGLMVARELPGQSGTAYVLGLQGVRMLEQIDIKASTGTHIGSFNEDGAWSPPQTWEHDLLTAGVLVRLAADAKVAMIYTEKEILRARAPAVKIADALVVYNCGKVSWIEVEQAKKSDPAKMKLLGQALSAAASGTMDVVCLMPSNRAEPGLYEPALESVKVKVNAAMVVFDVAATTNHRKNVGSAIARETNCHVNIEWAACTTTRSGVSEVEYSTEATQPDEVAKLAVRLHAGAYKNKAINPDVTKAFMRGEGNYDAVNWQTWSEDMQPGKAQTFAVHINGIVKATGLTSMTAAQSRRDQLVKDVVVQDKKLAAAGQSDAYKPAVAAAIQAVKPVVAASIYATKPGAAPAGAAATDKSKFVSRMVDRKIYVDCILEIWTEEPQPGMTQTYAIRQNNRGAVSGCASLADAYSEIKALHKSFVENNAYAKLQEAKEAALEVERYLDAKYGVMPKY